MKPDPLFVILYPFFIILILLTWFGIERIMQHAADVLDVLQLHILRYATIAISGIDVDEAAIDEAVGESLLGFAHRHTAVEHQLGSVIGIDKSLQRHLVELTPLVVDDTHLGLSVEEIVEEMTELVDGHLVGDAQHLFNLFVFHIIFHCFPDNIVTFSEISFLFHTCISLSHTLTIAQVSRLQYSRSDWRAAVASFGGIV